MPMNAKLVPQAPHRPVSRRLAVAVGVFVTLVTVLVFQFSSSTQTIQAFTQDASPQQQNHRALRNMDAQALPTLRLHFIMKRSTLNVHGLSEFDVLANPVVSDKSVSYNSVATFQVGDVTHKYIVVDGVTYHVTESAAGTVSQTITTCLAADSFPQVSEILAALNGASRINGVQSSQSIDCPSDKLYKLAFGGETFVLCSTLRTNGSGFKVFGADLSVEVRYMSSAVSIVAPALTAEQAEACGKLTSSASVSTRTMSLLSGATSSSSTNSYVNVAADFTVSDAVLADATCTCKSAKRPCIFFHGLGQATEGAVADTSTYFGDIKSHAPCCTTIKFANLNTVNFGWNNDTLQQKVCDIALSQSATSSKATKVIADTIVVAHSMGNNMLAGAISTGKCSLAKSSEWVALSGPMKGSMGSDYLQKSCGSGGLSGLIAGIVGKCPADTATKALAYEGDAYCPATLKAQYDAAQVSFKQSVTAAICSDGNTGLSSSDQLTYRLGGSIIGHKSSENDGIVSGCVLLLFFPQQSVHTRTEWVTDSPSSDPLCVGNCLSVLLCCLITVH